MGNFGDLNDYANARTSWLTSQGKSHRQVAVYIFQEYEKLGNQSNPNETFRKQKYSKKLDHAWLSYIKVFDTIRNAQVTTGDIDIISEFPLRGFSSSYVTPDGATVPDCAGDLIEWDGRLWEVADILEKIQFGYQFGVTWYHTVMRKTNSIGQGIIVEP